VKRSSSKILTTHVGALPELTALNKDAAGYEEELRNAVAAVVRKQCEIGLDVVNEGEYAKGGDWLSYLEERFDGFEQHPPAGGNSLLLQGKDREEFADFYAYATARGTLFYGVAGQVRPARPHWVCTRPISYRGEAALAREIEMLRACIAPEDAFLTTTAPASLEPYRQNDFYKTEEEFVFAAAEAMREEYKAIVDAGFLLQIDDPDLPDGWQMFPEMSVADYRKYAEVRVEALNHALRNIPAERARIRFAQCVTDDAAHIVFAQDGGIECVAATPGAAVAHGLLSSPLQQYSLRICLTASLISARDRAKALLAFRQPPLSPHTTRRPATRMSSTPGCAFVPGSVTMRPL